MNSFFICLVFVVVLGRISFADVPSQPPANCPALAGKYSAKQCRAVDSQNPYVLVEIVQPNCFVIGTRVLNYSKEGTKIGVGNTTWLATETGLYVDSETSTAINSSERVYNENSLVEYNYVTNKSNNATVLNVVNYISIIKDGNINANFFKLNNLSGVYINEKNCRSEL